ncbi:NEW3 domain-containing protein [Amycolatopsis roodepoortensis]|uniref:Alpha-galactosidase NEW3 domain-containing protein n=1 Tax=Amycolatopsis roodepoortensis TaxID=700274 RepID=A0ABR9L0S3_9PSEU|nr:NEW3 domain-containing protein [Amycolatopsis roodepoortensis]MBE1573793.1 hypothetical protein [Amycolatopsis roodepoortensis]
MIGAGDRQDVRLFGTSAVGGIFPEDRNGSVTLSVPAVAGPGQAVTGTLSFTNGTPLPVRDVSFSLPANGFRVEVPAGPRLVMPGKTVQVPVKVIPETGVKPDDYQLTASASYKARLGEHRVTDSVTVTVPHASLSAAYGNVGVTDAAHVAVGDIDGGGSSFRAEGLAEAGLKPGAGFSALGARLTWPVTGAGQKDNVLASGQTIEVRGSGTKLVLTGTGTGTAKGTVVVRYADGSTSQAELGFPNWCCADPAQYGATTVATVMGKNTRAGAAYPTTPYRVFANSVPLTAGKEVVAVTLPSNTAMHVFAAGIG